MSAIASTGSSSGYSAVAQLLANSVSAGLPQSNQPSAPGTSSPTASSDSLTLSDHAKAVLAQAKADKVAADALQAFLQSARNPNGSNSKSAQESSPDDGTKIFDELTGHSQSQQGSSTETSLADLQKTEGSLGGLTAYTKAVSDASEQPDGTYKNYSQTLNNVIVVPSTPQDIAAWYQTDGKAIQMAAQAWPDDNPGLAEAIANHAVTFLNANDIPGLNFHNSIVIQGGEDGGSGNESGSYNQQAPIFTDPTTSYKVLADGTVLSWKTPAADGTAT